MTEDEAKTKVCPIFAMASIKNINNLSIEQLQHVSDCVGSNCMMWRWGPSKDRCTNGGLAFKERHGFCGLAGKEGP